MLKIRWWLYHIFRSSTLRAGWWTTETFPSARVFLNIKEKQLFAFANNINVINSSPLSICIYLDKYTIRNFSYKVLHFSFLYYCGNPLELPINLLSNMKEYRCSLHIFARNRSKCSYWNLHHFFFFIEHQVFSLNVTGLLFPNRLIVCC